MSSPTTNDGGTNRPDSVPKTEPMVSAKKANLPRPDSDGMQSSDLFFKEFGFDDTKELVSRADVSPRTPLLKRDGTNATPDSKESRMVPKLDDKKSSDQVAKPGSSRQFDSDLPPAFNKFLQYREVRHECSFPGILKIIIPETSLVPIALAVRVVNFSAGGTLVEIHERHRKLDLGSNLCTRFFELKVAHSEVPELRGTVAWTDTSGKTPQLGLKFHAVVPQLVRIFDPSGQTEWGGAPPLPMPVLDPFPPTTLEPTVFLTGEAKEALEVVVKSATGEEKAAPVRNGRFSIELRLSEAAENYFVLRSQAGTRMSRRLPIEITFFSLSEVGSVRFDASLDERRRDEQIVSVEFLGPARQGERVLQQFIRMLGVGDNCAITAKIISRKGFERDVFDAMRREGEGAITAEQLQNDVMRLLED